MSRRLLLGLCGGLWLLLCLPALAASAPVTVNLRIEGKAATLYEAAVTTDVRTIDVGDGSGPHTCDGTNNGANPTPGPTRGAAFVAGASGPGGFTFHGTWFASFQDASFDTIAGQSVAYDPTTTSFLVEYKNAVASSVGSCQDKIAGGDDVLYAYGTGGEQLLKLSGPATVPPGGTATLRVSDAASNAPVAGATINGASTAADGTVNVVLPGRGPQRYKASKPGAIRSNGVTVCATDGADGACGTAQCVTSGNDGRCGTRDRTAPVSGIRGIREGQRFARKKGPRRLRAHVDPDPSGLRSVKLRLTRNDHRRCSYFSGPSERFRRNRLVRGKRCGAERGYWFEVGAESDIDYLLPRRLSRGRYVLDVTATDKAGNRDAVRQRGRNRVVFYVR